MGDVGWGGCFFPGGWRGLGHGGWRGGMSLKDCHVISKEGGESGVFCEARCDLSGVGYLYLRRLLIPVTRLLDIDP